MSSTRIERRKNIDQLKRSNKRRRKKGPFKIGLIILTFIIALFGYGIFQYYSGFISASGDGELPNADNKANGSAFKGVEDLEKINVLILGVDSKSEEGRSDTIMVAQYDPETGIAKLASLMRDSYVSIPGHSDNKLNQAYNLGGPELVRQTIKENFGIDVQYYAMVNFDGFAQVADILSPDGVNIDVEKRMKYTDRAGGLYIDFQPGLQKLNGKELLEYARFRHDAESDFGRVRRQQQVISAIKDELISINGISKLPKMMGTVQPYLETNLPSKTILGLATNFLMNKKDIETIRIPVDGSFENKSYRHAGAVLELDREENKQALQDFFSSTQVVNKDVSMKEVAADVR
ncbi:LCP family protein [Schinkia sp. CFF1]